MKSRDEYNLIFVNGESHLSSATNLADKGHYGFAISHIILGIEELIKYQVIQYVSKNDDRFDGELEKIYRSHPTKHDLLKEFIVSITADFYENGVELLYKVIVQGELNEDLEKVYENRFGQIGMYLNVTFKDLKIQDKELAELLEWLKTANILKNDGFYVDYRNNQVKKPSDLNNEDYLKAKRFGDIILQYTAAIKAIDLTDDEFMEMLK